MTILTTCLLAAALALPILGAFADTPSADPTDPSPPVVEIEGNVHITEHTVWSDAHYRVRGNIFLEPGGALVVERATIELLNTYSRELNVFWRGGSLITRDATLGGTETGGTIYHSNFELRDGEWDLEDTTVRYSYGIVCGSAEGIGRLRATRLIAGPSPDTVIMSGRGDAVIRDSEYAISLSSAAVPGVAVFNFPIGEPITQVYDSSSLPGVQYRLELVNTRVGTWFLFVQLLPGGPLAEFHLRHSPSLIPSIMAHNLQGTFHLPTADAGGPVPAGTSFTTGNLIWRVPDKPANIRCWGVYLTGQQTDVTITGPSRIAEAMVAAGRLALIGSPGTHDLHASATTLEAGGFPATGDPVVGPPAELLLRNASVGHFWPGTLITGQITAQGRGKVTVENSRCANLMLITKGEGTITLSDVEWEGEPTIREHGGPIRILP